PDSAADHEVELDEGYNPFAQPSRSSRTSALSGDDEVASPRSKTESSLNFSRSSERFQDWEKLYDDFVKKRDDGYASMIESKVNAPEAELEMDTAAPVSATLQLKQTYILTPSRDGLMIIDQHRAHKRILYDSYITKVREKAFVCQRTMFPEVVELSPSQDAVLADVLPSLEELGFSLAPLGDHSWSINGVPSVLIGANPRDTLLGMIECVTETGEELASSLHERIALSMAGSSAIRRGQTLSATEMDKLISDLFRLPTPARTPDGKTIFTIVNLDDIAKMLG
ncbi:MAG: hypothetical protein K2K65_02345, partial [Duncaniella sp.]|nr:hypothetical protein [Duncaniella sp.]